MIETVALLQQADPMAGLMSFLPLILVFAIFWFLVIAPTRKRQKELQTMIENLQRGDRVVTHGGLHGEVVSVEPTTVLLKIGDGVKVKVEKSGIAGKAPEPGQAS
jgi:preprotein translocase subunit YajC